MSTKKQLRVSEPAATRTLAPEELNARRKRKAFTAPIDLHHGPVEPSRTGRRTVVHPGIHPSKIQQQH